ncbi:DUF924 family protein [soil metagenome]
MSAIITPDDVITFWLAAGERRWFFKDTAFDGVLAVRFREHVEIARRGDYDTWTQTARGALSTIILLDQMSRNIYRGSPLAFAGDAKALDAAKSAVGRGFHWQLPASQALWLFMPFEHSENIDDQERAIALFTAMGSELTPYAVMHRDIIAKFGRFPHRNPVLGRLSTPAELAFLAAGGFAG